VAGRPENRSKPEKMLISLPGDTHKYLVHLATIGKKGVTENDVAVQILIAEVERLQKEEFEKIISPHRT
jgi:hypothetical protein